MSPHGKLDLDMAASLGSELLFAPLNQSPLRLQLPRPQT